MNLYIITINDKIDSNNCKFQLMQIRVYSSNENGLVAILMHRSHFISFKGSLNKNLKFFKKLYILK